LAVYPGKTTRPAGWRTSTCWCRETYELFKEHWTGIHEGDYAARINSMPKLIASTTLHEPLEWNATLIQGDIADAIAKLKREGRGLPRPPRRYPTDEAVFVAAHVDRQGAGRVAGAGDQHRLQQLAPRHVIAGLEAACDSSPAICSGGTVAVCSSRPASRTRRPVTAASWDRA
jgi:hypothetical protein